MVSPPRTELFTMKLAAMLVAALVLAAPAGVVAARIDTLQDTASSTRSAERIRNATPTADPPPPAALSEAVQVLALVNNERSARGLAPMQLDTSLNAAAFGHSATQAAAGRIFHVAPDGSDPGVRIARTGYQFSSWGENVAAGYRNANAVMTAWMNSPGHCRNLLNPAFTELGVGYVRRADDPSRFFSYWTQVFARPAGVAQPPGNFNPAWC